MTAMLVVGMALLLCTKMIVNVEASLSEQFAQAQARLSRTAWGSGVVQSESPSALSIQTATDFLSAVALQDYRSAYADLGLAMTMQLMPDEFAGQAQSDDRCYGTLLRYTQIGERATGEMGEMEVLTYSLVRKQAAPYHLDLTFTQDGGSGKYLVADFGQHADLGPTPSTCP